MCRAGAEAWRFADDAPETSLLSSRTVHLEDESQLPKGDAGGTGPQMGLVVVGVEQVLPRASRGRCRRGLRRAPQAT